MGLLNVTVAIGFAMVPVFARLVRSIVITLVYEEYVVAARSLGASDLHIIWKHILPNMMPPIIVQASAMLAVAIGTASALNFIGARRRTGHARLGHDGRRGTTADL